MFERCEGQFTQTIFLPVLKMRLRFIKSIVGGHHSSVHLFVTSMLWSWVHIPSAPSMLLPFIVTFCTIFVIVLRKGKNKQIEAEFGPFLKKKLIIG